MINPCFLVNIATWRCKVNFHNFGLTGYAGYFMKNC